MQKPARKQGRYKQPNHNMLDDHGFEIYEQNPFPIAYLLTFRTFGTWLHGDNRTSVSRRERNLYGTPKTDPNVRLREAMESELNQPPMILDNDQRNSVTQAITEVCTYRDYILRALNTRTNHVHSVVSAAVRPEKIINDFKAYSTRRLRVDDSVLHDLKIWSRGASTRYLWKPRQVEAAVDYVLYCQEDIPFEFKDLSEGGDSCLG